MLAISLGNTYQSVEHFGTSAWMVTRRVMAKEPGGNEKAYFLKVCVLLVSIK